MRSNNTSVYCYVTGQKLVSVMINTYGCDIKQQAILDWFNQQGWIERERWMRGSTTTGYHLHAIEWHFRNENDAMLFKLAWA